MSDQQVSRDIGVGNRRIMVIDTKDNQGSLQVLEITYHDIIMS